MFWNFLLGILPITAVFERMSQAVGLIFDRLSDTSFGNLSLLATWFEDATKAVGTFWDANQR